MSNETETPKVYSAICAVTADLAKVGISKDRKNQSQGYSFRGIDDVYAALSPLLSKHKLCMLPRVTSRECVERQTKSGGALFYTVCTVEFDFVSAEDGSRHTIITVGEAMDSGDKGSNKAMSAALKYAAFMAFCIPVEGEEDADAVTHEVAPSHAPGKPAPKPKPQTPEDKLRAELKAIGCASKEDAAAVVCYSTDGQVWDMDVAYKHASDVLTHVATKKHDILKTDNCDESFAGKKLLSLGREAWAKRQSQSSQSQGA